MRQSRYVVEARGNSGECLLYNVANGAFVQIGGNVLDAWCNPHGGAPESELERLGFLVEETEEQELRRQQSLFDSQRADASKLAISFIPTYVCNFRCPYCYEIGHNKIQGKMDGKTMDAVLAFVQRNYEDNGFGRLEVQWYGGDPSLALDAVEELTRRLVEWCEGKSVAYDAFMLTNANVIDEDAADLIERCRVSSVYLTIDGPEELHNRRRVAANGSNSYRNTIAAAKLFAERGINLTAAMNTDKVNIVHYAELRDTLQREAGIALAMAKLNDYGHFYGQPPFCPPDFDLFEHDEFFQAQLREFEKIQHDAGEMREMLRPVRRFCSGQLDNYFIIDLLGDVYTCDGRVGMKDYVKFNIFEPESTWRLHEVTFDATRDEKCSVCELLPVCLGSCTWERACCGMPCHPLKTTIEGYLKVYRGCFDVADAGEELVVLAEPFSRAELGWDML